MKYKCLSSNKSYSNKIDEELKKRFKNTFKFTNNDINKFILLLRKEVYPYEYMNKWKKFDETTYLEKEKLYRNLNIEEKMQMNVMICILKVIHQFWLMFLKTLEKLT